MQFLELLGCANGGMNTCSHAADSVNVFAPDRTGSGALCSADRGSGRLRAGKEFVLLTAMQAVACENVRQVECGTQTRTPKASCFSVTSVCVVLLICID